MHMWAYTRDNTEAMATNNYGINRGAMIDVWCCLFCTDVSIESRKCDVLKKKIMFFFSLFSPFPPPSFLLFSFSPSFSSPLFSQFFHQRGNKYRPISNFLVPTERESARCQVWSYREEARSVSRYLLQEKLVARSRRRSFIMMFKGSLLALAIAGAYGAKDGNKDSYSGPYKLTNGNESSKYGRELGWHYVGGSGRNRYSGTRPSSWARPSTPSSNWSRPARPSNWSRPTRPSNWDKPSSGTYDKCDAKLSATCCNLKSLPEQNRRNICSTIGCDYDACDWSSDGWDGDTQEPTSQPTWAADGWNKDGWNDDGHQNPVCLEVSRVFFVDFHFSWIVILWT